MPIVIVQLINYTLSFLMWMIVGRAILARIIGNRENVMLLAFVKVTEPVFVVTRKLMPFAQGPWVPVLSFFLIVAVRLTIILVLHPAALR